MQYGSAHYVLRCKCLKPLNRRGVLLCICGCNAATNEQRASSEPCVQEASKKNLTPNLQDQRAVLGESRLYSITGGKEFVHCLAKFRYPMLTYLFHLRRSYGYE